MTFAHVAVDVPARAGALFTYAVPHGMAVEPGFIVVVPFASRTVPGIVVRVDSSHPDLPTKPVQATVVGAPCLDARRIATAEWLAGHYRQPLFAALSLFLPPGWRRAVSRVPSSGDRPPVWVFDWPKPPLSEDAILGLNPRYPGSDAPGERTARGRALNLLAERGPIPVRVLAAEARCAMSTLRSMVKEGLLAASVEGEPPAEAPGSQRGQAVRQEPSHMSPQSTVHSPQSFVDRIVLNEDQTNAYAPVAVALESRSHRVFLLHGVTGSGKTHVYFRLIEAAIRNGRQAIVLVSEIAQAPEALARYAQRFPGRVALLHSALPTPRRAELWHAVERGQYDVVVGPRSALFAPVPNPGLIVMDEEHEPSYKQDDLSPRYHARDVAIEMGRQFRVPVVLGSATPDVSSYYLSTLGAYELLTLPDRYAGPTARGPSSGKLPDVRVVDLRGELRTGNTSILSRALQNGIRHILDQGEQAILFLNRRGSSTAVVCRDCGHVLTCGRCDVALVYHRETTSMLCHQCNRETPPPEKCPKCKGRRISYFGAGTERVEEEVRKLFPDARVLRWDHDVAVRRGGHEQIHEQFRRHEADILVGTQMIAKALDFPLVTLVGVVLADVTLHLPDFRAAERTYQLLSQVAGRAGRGEAEGRVIIQTYSPDHYAIVAAARHDYTGFYEQEMEFRRYHSYPPVRQMVRLLFNSAGEVRARYEALQMRKHLESIVAEQGIPDVSLIGPAPAFHSKVRSRWRWQIVLAGDGAHRLLSLAQLPRGWSADVDPVSLL